MSRSKISIALILSVFVFGCASISPGGYNSFTQPDAYRKDIYLSQHPDLSDKIKENILNGKVEIGMNEDEVETALGYPDETEYYQWEDKEGKKGLLVVWHYSYWLTRDFIDIPKLSITFADERVIEVINRKKNEGSASELEKFLIQKNIVKMITF